MSDLGIVIVHYGRSAPTIRCVNSVLEDSSTCTFKILLVDNFGNLREKDYPEGIEIIRCPENPGFGGGANAGVLALEERESCRIFLVLNNDAEIADGAMDAIVRVFDDPSVGAAGGPIRGSDGTLWYAGGVVCRLTGTVRQKRSEYDVLRSRDVGFIPGTALAVRAKAWREINGFDESFFLYNEDIDLCLRLKRNNWRLRFDPDVLCIHDPGESTGSGIRSALYLEQLCRGRLRPFRPKSYQLYLCLVHSIYNLTRMTKIFLHRGRAGRIQIRAIYTGHRAAVSEVLFGRKTQGRP